LAALAGCATSSAPGSPADSDEAPPPKTPPLRVGISTNAPPLAYKEGKRIVGLEADLAQALATELGRPLVFVELKWTDQIPALLDQRTDIIMSGMSITALRKVRIAFSDPYFRSGQMALTHARNRNRFQRGYYDLIGTSTRIGTIKGTTGDLFIQERSGNFPKTRVNAFDKTSQAIKALLDETIDVFIHDAPIILLAASQNEDKGLVPLYSLLTEEYLAWGIRKDDAELLKGANVFVNRIIDNGTLAKMINRWVPYLETE
jgi:polar amino acid transport system substrate-binding protein